MMSEQQQQPIAYHDTLSKFDGGIADSRISWAPTAPIDLTDNGFRVRCLALEIALFWISAFD